MNTTIGRSVGQVARELGVDRSQSDLVRLDEIALEKLARHIQKRSEFFHHEKYKWDDRRFWNTDDSPDKRSQYLTVGCAINFRFWSLADGRPQPASGWIEGEKFTGSMYLWRSLRRCLYEERFPILDAKFLASLSAEQFDGIFSDDMGENPLKIAADDRIANLRDLGSRLCLQWQDQFHNVVRAAGRSLVQFARFSSGFRAFDDPNFKLVMVNAILHSGSGIIAFDDDPLPGIDYHLLKQLLRHGVLRPRPELEQQIKAQKILDARDGHELRRVALNAFIRLSELTGISGEILDNRWWWNRLKCGDRNPVCLDPTTADQCPFFGACEQNVWLPSPLEMTRYY